MFCNKCGSQIDDNAVICPKCGCATSKSNLVAVQNQESKTGMGVLLALVLGLIGLIIGFCMYPAGTNARSTFVKGWGITFAVSMGVLILVWIFFGAAIIAALPYLPTTFIH